MLEKETGAPEMARASGEPYSAEATREASGTNSADGAGSADVAAARPVNAEEAAGSAEAAASQVAGASEGSLSPDGAGTPGGSDESPESAGRPEQETAQAERTPAATASSNNSIRAIVTVIAVAAALLLGLLAGSLFFGGVPGGSPVSGKTSVSEQELDSAIASFSVDGKNETITIREVIEQASSLAMAKREDGSYTVPSADAVLSVARNRVLVADAEARGITVTDEDVSAYAEKQLGTSDLNSVGANYSMDADSMMDLLRESCLMAKLRESVVGDEGNSSAELPLPPNEPAAALPPAQDSADEEGAEGEEYWDEEAVEEEWTDEGTAEDENAADEDSTDENAADEEATDGNAADEEAADEEAAEAERVANEEEVDENATDEEATDEEAATEDASDEETAENEEATDEEAVAEDATDENSTDEYTTDDEEAVEDEYATDEVAAPATRKSTAQSKEYADYIIDLAGDEWDKTKGAWASSDGPFFQALSAFEITPAGATYEAAMAAYYVAYQLYSEATTATTEKWTEYVNSLLDKSSITIYTLRT